MKEMEYVDLEYAYRMAWYFGATFLWIRLFLPFIGSIIFLTNYFSNSYECIPKEAVPALFGFMLFLSFVTACVVAGIMYKLNSILYNLGLTEECKDDEDDEHKPLQDTTTN